jgi:hypothetical protein
MSPISLARKQAAFSERRNRARVLLAACAADEILKENKY